MKFCFWATWLLATTALAETEPRPNEGRHVVVVVWDGMRPDFVSEANTPALWKLAQEGVTFQRHHSVYLTATNVNGTVMATGVFPGRNGIIANREFRPSIDDRRTPKGQGTARGYHADLRGTAKCDPRE